ncbi:hypothetical protein DNTS_029364 [Danionella cerebrum]|uniref:ETS domain-containing protein n=1 Tax=Danionella cerebrum TaxID=2873325 RepID=A0A553Q7X0_9TELE|nr:hypothetical protein DNTS_029364 [Danionella translucida]
MNSRGGVGAAAHPVMISNGGSSMGSGFSPLAAGAAAAVSPFSAGTSLPFTSSFTLFSSFFESFSTRSFLRTLRRGFEALLFLSAISETELRTLSPRLLKELRTSPHRDKAATDQRPCSSFSVQTFYRELQCGVTHKLKHSAASESLWSQVMKVHLLLLCLHRSEETGNISAVTDSDQQTPTDPLGLKLNCASEGTSRKGNRPEPGTEPGTFQESRTDHEELCSIMLEFMCWSKRGESEGESKRAKERERESEKERERESKKEIERGERKIEVGGRERGGREKERERREREREREEGEKKRGGESGCLSRENFSGIPLPSLFAHLVTPLSISHLAPPSSRSSLLSTIKPQRRWRSFREDAAEDYTHNSRQHRNDPPRRKRLRFVMATSDLSLILNNANANLYPEPHANLFSTPAAILRAQHLSEITYGANNTIGSWEQLNPHLWSRQNVLEWIGFHVEENRFDASNLNLNYCNMDGLTLCAMSREGLVSMFGTALGELLHHSLESQKVRYASDSSESTVLSESEFELLDKLLRSSFESMQSSSLGPLLETVVVQSSIPSDPSERKYSYYEEYASQLTPESDHGYDSLSESFHSSNPGSFLTPSSPESSTSDSEHEFPETLCSASSQNLKPEHKSQKRGRGRPPKLRDSEGFGLFIQTKKSKHAPRGTHLWEFIRDILIHPEQNQGLMKWEDRRDGVFKFLKSEAVAQLWGQKKKNSSMTYEKLSRAMRYYYKREILERVDGRRLVYKFGKNSTGWRMEETEY